MKKVKVNMEFKFIVSLIFAVIVAIFAIQNAGSIDVRFFFAKFRISQAVVILGSAIIGAIIAVLLGLIKQIKLSMKVKQLTKEVDNLNKSNLDLQTRMQELNKTINKDSEINDNVVEENSDVESEIM
ncbi:MAG: LapA family protein [Tissierellaceae bacterium]|nr:LapA family protein [Tissierellaceae bacterium]